MKKSLFVLGRAIFGGYFAWSGLNHFLNRQQMSGYAGAKGVSSPGAAVLGSGAMLLAGGASIATGARPKLGLLALIGFLIPTSIQMHDFWTVDDPQQRMSEMINFTKNMALVGACLMMMQLPEPWPASVPQRRLTSGPRRVTLPQFTQRDLRAMAILTD